MRTYLSVFVLLCLAVQFIPLTALHSHEDHHDEVKHAVVEHTDEVNSDSSASDFQFETSDDCDLCDLLLALNDQHLSFHTPNDMAFIGYQHAEFLGTSNFLFGDLNFAVRGRAPPTV